MNLNEIQNRLNILNPGFTVVGKSKTKSNYCIIKCENEHIFERRTDADKLKQKCKFCYAESKKLSENQVQEIIRKNLGNDYKLISYENSKYIEILHKECNRVSIKSLVNIKQHKGCVYCNKPEVNNDSFLENPIIKSKLNEYEILSEYNGCHNKIKIRHNICNKIFEMTPVNFKKQNCPYCNGTPKKTTEEFRKEIYELTDGRFELLSEYKTNKTKVKIKSLECNHEFYIKPIDFLRNPKCTVCRKSKKEKQIESFLKENQIEFESEKSIKINNSILKIDFLIDENFGIEYDGEQHFQSIYGNDCLIRQHLNDLKKNQYFIENGMNLIRIPYDIKIDEIKDIILKRNEITNSRLLIIRNGKVFNEESYYGKFNDYS